MCLVFQKRKREDLVYRDLLGELKCKRFDDVFAIKTLITAMKPLELYFCIEQFFKLGQTLELFGRINTGP